MNLWKIEPVVIATLVRSAVLLATAFGLKWSAEQIAAIMVFVEAVLALVVRGSVSPTKG